jgi:hypothetical protein
LAFGLVAALAVASVGMAQSTKGSIEGTVKDDSGAPLPGVTVTVRSPAMQGERLEVTGANGVFRLVNLPPGVYSAVFDLEGFQQIEQADVRVGIAQTVRMEVELPAAYSDELVVTSERPVVDVSSTELGVNISSDLFNDIPNARDAWSVARVAPGAQTDSCDPSNPYCGQPGFYGSTSAENAYYIDGVNTTGIELGQQGKSLNMEFIQEVQVKTAGYTAEYGRAIGGMVNVITKSGGNEFQGDVFGYYDDIQSSRSGAARLGPVTGTRMVKEFTQSDLGVGLGGPISQDKLWFFVAYNRVDNSDDVEVLEDFATLLPIPGAPSQGQIFKDDTETDLWAAKLTWQAGTGHSLSASGFGDPTTQTGTGGRSLGATPLHFLGTDESGADDYVVNYDGVLSDKVVVNARVARHEESYELFGPGTEVPGYIDFTDPLGDGTTPWGFIDTDGTIYESGYGFYQNQPELQREQYNADISYFVDEFGGSHEFKAGYEFEDISGQNDNFNGGTGQRIYRFSCDPAARFCGDPAQPYYYRHRFFTLTNTLDPEALVRSDVLVPLSVGIKTENDAIYVQDTWRPVSNLTLNLGYRMETQQLFNAFGEVSADLSENDAPRLGFIWDPTSKGKSKIFAHYGRFYETIPMDIVIRSFGGEISIFSYNLSPSPNDVALNPDVRSSRFLGGGVSRVDPNLEGQYLDELVVGGEMEVAKGLSVGLKYITRDLKNVIEDALAADGDYFIGNPGKGLMEGTYDIGYAYGYNETLHTLPIPTREYEGVELTVSQRPSGRFQYLASLLWSELKGSYDGSFQLSTGQLDPNLNSAFDYFDFSVNNEGFLSNDRKWQVKFDGIYQFDMGLTAGLSAWYRTGTPITAMGYSTAYNNWEYYLSKRGAFGRVDDAYEADLHLGYPFQFGNGMELNLVLDIFNLLDAQTETLRDIQYTVDEVYQPLDWETGQTTAITPGDPATPPTSAGFNTTNAWTNPRRFRIGVRLSF